MLSIEKNKIIYTSTYNPNERQEVYPKNVSKYLSDIIEIKDFVTFARVFDIIIENKNIFNDIYSKTMGDHKIDHYLDEYNKPYEYSKDVYDLEVYRNVELHKYDGEGAELEQHIGFHGVGNFEGDEEKEPYNISLSFVPINNLKQRYIRVNHEVKLIDFRSKKLKRIPCNSEITVFEFFEGILNDISFFGTPEDRNEKSEELLESSKGIKDGDIRGEPIEKLMEEWKLEAEKSKAKEDKKRRKRLNGTYISDYLQDRISKTLEELGILENDLIELERYEEAKQVTDKMKELKKI